MKNKKLLCIAILIFTFILLMGTKSWAGKGKLYDCLYKNGKHHILNTFYDPNKGSGQIDKNLNEELNDYSWGKSDEADAIRKDGSDWHYYYYYWLYGAVDMTNYIQTDGDNAIKYTNIGEKDSKEDIYAAVKVLTHIKGYLGSFVDDDNKLPRSTYLDEVKTLINDDGYFEEGYSDKAEEANHRSGKAYGNITNTKKYYQVPTDGKVIDEYEIKVNQCIEELKAAYDYSTKTDTFGNENGKGVYINDDENTKKNYNKSKIRLYIQTYGQRNIPDGVKDTWKAKAGVDDLGDIQEEYMYKTSTGQEDAKIASEELTSDAAEKKEKKDDSDKDTVFKQPTGTTHVSSGAEDAMTDAESFLSAGDKDIIEKGDLQEFSQNLYGILLAVGVVVAVIIGVILGVKLMLAPVGEKAEAKKLLIPYVVGCVVVFGAFGIWKLVVTLMQGI